MKNTFRNSWALIIPIAILLLTISVLTWVTINRHRGHFIYALDDPYIHMAMAKNLAQHGVWGVTQFEFSSSSSSLLWTLLLAGIYRIFGVNEITPFLLNAGISIVALYVLFLLLKKNALPLLYIFLVLLAVIFLTPLPALIFSGQEHVIHALLTILFVYLSATSLSSMRNIGQPVPETISLMILAPMITLARYEGLFVVAVVCILGMLRKRRLFSFLLGMLAIIPITIYGIISVSHGWFWLPNSVLMKGHIPDWTSFTGIKEFFESSIHQLLGAPSVVSLMIAAIILFLLRLRKGLWEKWKLMTIVFLFTAILHLLFAKTGWFYRYEAYLVALGLFVISVPLFECISAVAAEKNHRWYHSVSFSAIVFLAIIALLPVARVRIGSTLQVPRATTNIYEQQYQMGTYLQRYYRGAMVAANDIGAINFLADIHCLDLWGLGSIEVAMKKRLDQFDRHQIDSLTGSKDVRIAILYDDWYRRGGVSILPSRWMMIGQWRITNNIVCGGKTVSFYAASPSEKNNLCENLKAFSSQLPDNVFQMGEYVDSLNSDARSPSTNP